MGTHAVTDQAPGMLPSVAMDRLGNVHMVSSGSDGVSYYVRYSVKTPAAPGQFLLPWRSREYGPFLS